MKVNFETLYYKLLPLISFIWINFMVLCQYDSVHSLLLLLG